MSEPEKRWPTGVYDHGEEPDPRMSLANERTFLAWVRTGLALLAGAAAVDALDLPLPDAVQTALAVVLAVAAIATAVSGWRGWARTERAMRLRRPLPGNPAMAVVAGVVVVAAVVLAAGTLWSG